MASRLAGKRALVTGSSRGIGAAIARLFAREGAKVVVNYKSSKNDAQRVVDRIRNGGGQAFAMKADISVKQEVEKMFGTVASKLGGLDVLVNNAGLASGRIWNAKLEEIEPEMWEEVFGVDVYGTFSCCQQAALLMKSGGTIINIASTPAVVGDVEGVVYGCGKGAVLTMTKMLSRILAPRIRVNCMVLGSFETSWTDWLGTKHASEMKASIPLGRFGRPEEVANLALFLASSESSYITGQGIVIDGGEVTQ